MAEREALRLVMRGIGTALAGLGLADGIESLFTAWGLHSSHYYSAADRVAAGVSYLAAGLVLAFSANLIARIFYGQK